MELSLTAPPACILIRLITTKQDNLSKADAIIVAAIETGMPTLAAARDLMVRFHRMIGLRDAKA